MKKAIYKHLWRLMFIVLICVCGVSCGDSDQEEQSEQPESTPIEYDALQQVFLALNNDTTIGDLYRLIADNDLAYTSQDYNGTPKTTHVKLAYSQGVALQRYADMGDHVKVAFDKQLGTFMYVEYFNLNAFKTALYYNYGTYWKFFQREANNSYTGYYYYTPGDNHGGIVIGTETGYHKCSDGEEAIKNAISE